MPKKSGKSGRGGRGGAASKHRYDIQDGQISEDEIDAFHSSRDKIALDGSGGRRGKKSSNVLEDSEDEDAEIMGLDMSDEDSDEDGLQGYRGKSYDDEEEAEEAEQRQKAIEDEDKITSAWGRKKSIYYSADTVDADADDESDAEELRMEEEEAIRLQNERLAGARDDDFDDEAMLEAVVSNIEKSKKKSSKKSGSSAPRDDDEAMLQSMNQDLNMISMDLEGGDIEVENVRRDLSSMPRDRQLELLSSESPELVPLMQDVQLRIGELREEIGPALAMLKETKLATHRGIEYLHHRQHLLEHYVMLVTFYLYLRAEQRQQGQNMSAVAAKGHPCLDQIVAVRSLIDALEPMHEKIRPQVIILLEGDAENEEVLDELRDILNIDDESEEDEEDAGDEDEQDDDDDDDDEDADEDENEADYDDDEDDDEENAFEDDEDDEDEDEEEAAMAREAAAMRAKARSAVSSSSKSADQKKSSKKSAAFVDDEDGDEEFQLANFENDDEDEDEELEDEDEEFDEDDENGDEDVGDELESRLLQLSSKSKTLKAEKNAKEKLTSASASTHLDATDSGNVVVSLKRQVQKEMMGGVNPRLLKAQLLAAQQMQSKQDKAEAHASHMAMQQQAAKLKALENLNKSSTSSVSSSKKQDSTAAMMAAMKEMGDLFGDDEIGSSKKSSSAKGKQLRSVKYADEDDGDEDALDFYNKQVEAQQAQKDAKKASKVRELEPYDDPTLLDEEARRHASRQIVKNRGLTPYRKADVRNPRVHLRHKYEKAMIKRRALVKEYKGKEEQYAGEKTGIKTNVTRSVKLK